MSGVAAMRVAMDTPVNTIGRVGIDTYLFLESGNVTSEAGDEWWLVEEGDMKFNIFVSEWNFCNPCLLGNLEVRGSITQNFGRCRGLRTLTPYTLLLTSVGVWRVAGVRHRDQDG